MSSDSFERIEALFLEVCDLTEEERGPRLDAACGDDAELRRQVEGLLRAEAGGHPPDRDQVKRAAAVETPRAKPEDRKKGPAELHGNRLSPRVLVIAAVAVITLIVVVVVL